MRINFETIAIILVVWAIWSKNKKPNQSNQPISDFIEPQVQNTQV